MAVILGVSILTFVVAVIGNTAVDNSSSYLKNGIFASNLYSCVKSATNANFVISPLSLQIAGALILAGAGGQTAQEIMNGFQLSRSGEKIKATLQKYTENPYVQIANKMYFAKGIHLKPEFRHTVSQDFLSRAENVDFSRANKIARKINNWIRNVTSEKIHDVVDSVGLKSDTRLLLVNAIHFNGGWKNPFEKTSRALFWKNRNEKKVVEMMRVMHDFKFKRSAELNAYVLEMDYNNTDISLMVILPKSRTGLAHLEKKLQSVDLLELSRTLKPRDVIVLLPKFKIVYSTDLHDVFIQMGMGTMFSDQADFKQMVGNDSIKVDKVVHKAFIEVNEAGTEAAGVTTIAMAPIKLRPRKRFEANHPFFFAIKSKTVILFVGRYKG